MAEVLEVDREGEVLEGWKDVSVSRAFDRFAGSFSLRIADLEATDPKARKLRRGELVTLKLDGEIVLTGRIVSRTKTRSSPVTSTSPTSVCPVTVSDTI